jgi:hypothetical protein
MDNQKTLEEVWKCIDDKLNVIIRALNELLFEVKRS